MNAKNSLAAIAAIAAGAAFAATATYTAGDTSLADGKVEFTYDESGKITELRMNPDYGETLTLTGDTLDFAAGANVHLGHCSTNEIRCAISSAGIVNLNPDGPYTWTTSNRGLKSKTFETLFENCDIDAIEPVSATPVSYLAQSGDTAYPYFITRGTDADGTKWMKFELQCYNNGKTTGTASYLRALYIQLKQNGSNVAGKIIDGGYWAFAKSNQYYGRSMFLNRDTSISPYTHYTTYYAADTSNNGFGISALTVKTRGRLAIPVDGTLNFSTALSGGGVTVAFRAESATAVVNATGANTMTDGAYVIEGDAEHTMKFYAKPSSRIVVLPDATDVYGAGSEFHVWGYNNMGNGGSAGDSAITMHPGTKLFAENNSHAFTRTQEGPVLDGAAMTASKWMYVPKTLTLANGSSVSTSGNLSYRALYDTAATMTVSGTGESEFNADVMLMSKSSNRKEWTIDVADTVAGSGVDFTFNGDIEPSSNAAEACSVVKKTGEGTMKVAGQLKYTVNPTRILEGTLLLGKSGATVSGHKFSLEGGVLALAAGTANTVAEVKLTKSSAIAVGDGATLTVSSLVVPEGSTLAIDGDVFGRVKVSTALDAATLSRIKVNGHAAYQASNGYFCKRGFIISFH